MNLLYALNALRLSECSDTILLTTLRRSSVTYIFEALNGLVWYCTTLQSCCDKRTVICIMGFQIDFHFWPFKNPFIEAK